MSNENEADEDDIDTLIGNNPVTSVRYYRSKMNVIRQLISQVQVLW